MPMNQKDRDTAADIRKRTADAVARVRADQTLSDHGKRADLLALHKEANHKLRVERARIEERDTNRKADLERRLLGITPHALGADVISYRDAVDRASRWENAVEADQLISRARATGDKALERAVFAHAYEMAGPGPFGKPWNELVEAYLQARPELVDDVNELVVCSAIDSRIDTEMLLSVQVPHELNGWVKADGELREPVKVA